LEPVMEVMFGPADADVPPPKVVPIVPSKHYRTTAMTDLEIGLSVMVFLAAFMAGMELHYGVHAYRAERRRRRRQWWRHR
jgi:hypothetical protein